MDGIRIDPRDHGRSRVADCRQPGVDRRDVGIRDRRQPCLIEQPLLAVGKEERAIARDGTAEAAAVLLLRHRKLRPGQRVPAVERVVAEVAIEITARQVGAAARYDVDVAAKGASELGLAARGHHLKLVDGIDAIRHPAQSGGVVIRRQSIDYEVVGEVALAAD